MKELSKSDKELISRRESYIRELKEEKQNILDRLTEIERSIENYRRWNREIKGRDTNE